MTKDAIAPNPKVRRTGAVITLLAALSYYGAATGYHGDGTTGRVVFLVVGTLLLLVGLTLIRTRLPAITAIRADQSGMTFGVGHRLSMSIPWSDIEVMWLRRLGTISPGYILWFEYADHARRPSALRSFEGPTRGGGVRVGMGLNRRQAAAMLTELPAAAGSRYRGVVPS
jgi:hypothetical protein